MPSRPRAHQIEEESERAFRAAVPAQWVVRRLTPDYGIDLTVEIFDPDGGSTPFSFHVQLKATDNEDLEAALRDVRFPLQLGDYYSSLPIPVLVVRYHAPSGDLYARWWHSYNPLIAIRSGEVTKPTKTVGFRFSADDRWTDDTPADLVAGVQSFHHFRSPDLPLPLNFMVSIADDATPLSRVLLGLRSILSPVSDLMTVEGGSPAPDTPSITITSTEFTVALADTASITIAPEDRQIECADILCAAAFLLTRVDQYNLAAQLAVASAARSSLIFDFDVVFAVARAMYRAQRISDALDLIAQLNDRPEPDGRLAAFVIHSAVLTRGAHLTDAEARRAVGVAQTALELAIDRHEPTIAAVDAYNLGRALLRTGEREEAIEAFHKAGELDPSYLRRAYYHSDLAGVLFEAGRYEESANHYGRAIELGGRAIDRALRADALLMGGRYAEAQHEFTGYLETNNMRDDAEWRLKLRALNEVRRWGGDRQDRRLEEASALAERVNFEDPSLTLEIALDQIGEALRLDACCFPAFQRLAILSVEPISPTEFDTSRAVGPALAAAGLFRVEPDPWIGAFTVAANNGESDEFLYDLIITGLRLAGYKIVDGLLESDDPPRPELVALLERAAHDYESSRRPGGFVIRFPDPDGGGVIEVPFPPPGEMT